MRTKIIKDFADHFRKESINESLLNEHLDSIQIEVTTTNNYELIKSITNIEIKEAIFNIGKHKSSGLDGMTAEFYQTYWNIVGPSIYILKNKTLNRT